MIIEKYKKVGVGAWAAKALYDETVTALLMNDFDDLRLFVNCFPGICQNYGGIAASRKLKNAAQLLRQNQQCDLADRYLFLSQQIQNYPIAPPCLNLNYVSQIYDSIRTIYLRIESICEFLNCLPIELDKVLKEKIKYDISPQKWHLKLSSIYSRCYQEWFTLFAMNYLTEYLPPRPKNFVNPLLKIVNWSQQLWRSWRLLKNRPTLIDSGIRPAQFFVGHIIHDSVHIWQMQAYGSDWSNILRPQDFLFLEAQAMCAERKALDLMLNGQLQIPDWYPSTNESVILRLFLGILEREIRLNLDLSLYLYEQSFDDWIINMSRLTGISSNYFLGLSGELLGMPGFASAYTSVTDRFISMNHELRKDILKTPLNRLTSDSILGELGCNQANSFNC